MDKYMMFLLASAALFSLASCRPTYESMDCSVQRFDNCSNTLLILTNEEYIPASSAQELEKGCKIGLDALKCVRDYASYCLDSLPRILVRMVASGAYQAQKSVCTEEGIREALLHNECINKNMNEIKVCLREMTTGFANVPTEYAIEEVLGTGCCVFDRYRQCTTDLLRLNCGEETKDYFLWLTNSYTSDLFDLACVGYESGSKACPKILEKLPQKAAARISSFMSLLLKVFGNRL